MYHIPNDKRAQKSADLIAQGLYKCLEKKPLNDIKVNDIYLDSYVSRATFYRLFDSVYDVLQYQCDSIVEEIAESLKTKHFESMKEMGMYNIKLWLKHDKLIEVIVENLLYNMVFQSIINHKEGFKLTYGFDYDESPQTMYFVYYISAMVFTSFVICYKEKGKKSVEEIMEENNKIIRDIVNFWEIG